MNSNKTIVIKKEWSMMLIEAIRFFLQHSSIEFDGAAQVVKVKYKGPNGWNLSLSSSYRQAFEGPSSQCECIAEKEEH